MKRKIRIFTHRGDTVVAEYEEGLLTEQAKAEFERLMADANICIMDEQDETPATVFNPAHDYVAFRRMAGG